jgi:IS30 family transposase
MLGSLTTHAIKKILNNLVTTLSKMKVLKNVSEEEVKRAVDLINNRPKKKLGYRTTLELIAERKLNEVLSLA